MSLVDSITDLVTDTVTVSRTPEGSYVNGEYIKGTPSTFTADIVAMPAYNLNRVIGGANLSALVDDQKVTEVRQLYTVTELKTRTATTDPDVIKAWDGADWTVARVEKWPDLDGGFFYHVVVSRVTAGAA